MHYPHQHLPTSQIPHSSPHHTGVVVKSGQAFIAPVAQQSTRQIEAEPAKGRRFVTDRAVPFLAFCLGVVLLLADPVFTGHVGGMSFDFGLWFLLVAAAFVSQAAGFGAEFPAGVM